MSFRTGRSSSSSSTSSSFEHAAKVAGRKRRSREEDSGSDSEEERLRRQDRKKFARLVNEIKQCSLPTNTDFMWKQEQVFQLVKELKKANKKARPVDAIGLDELKRVVGGYCLTRQFLKSTMKLSFDATERYKYIGKVLKALTRDGREDFTACRLLGKHPSANMALMAEEVMNRIRTLRTMLKCSPTPEDKQKRKPSLQQLVCNASVWAGDRGEDDDAISVGTLRAAVEEEELPPLIQALIPTPHKKVGDAEEVDLAEFPGAIQTLRLDAYLLRTCFEAHGNDVVFGPWKASALTKEQKVTQQQLADLRAAFFAGRFPAALKKLLKYVARDTGSQNDMKRFLPAWEDLVTFLLEEVRSPGKKKGAKKAQLTKQSRVELSDDDQDSESEEEEDSESGRDKENRHGNSSRRASHRSRGGRGRG